MSAFGGKADMTNRCLPLSIYAAPFMPRHAANEIKQAGIGKRLGSGGPSGLSANSMRSATHNVSASAQTLTINTANS
jgi:hypothetical protein